MRVYVCVCVCVFERVSEEFEGSGDYLETALWVGGFAGGVVTPHSVSFLKLRCVM